ncbi:conserved unknown protein [Ectocarpus siliculosus]|uniref:ADP,ATP carrier protein n=1 Tax=Ectocarpus siliculosus TaxID=2880 RepID=D7FVM4_ECTSI|nr:conserved unknown protein [Ectocarpus siliculosus]|eukprot:CBJ31945.1 conserved unknown protein [Ectocarpus siliculosus]
MVLGHGFGLPLLLLLLTTGNVAAASTRGCKRAGGLLSGSGDAGRVRGGSDGRRLFGLTRTLRGGGAAGESDLRLSTSSTSEAAATLATSFVSRRKITASATELKNAAEPVSLGGVVEEGDEDEESAALVVGSAEGSRLSGATRVGEGVKVRGGVVAGLITKVFAIEKHELRKFLTMSVMMFAIIYVFTMTRDTKDALVVTNCGAEAIAFLKVYAVLPAAALFMIGYNWLSNHVGSRALFHMTITPFFAFYALFAFVMYPMRGILHHSAGAMGKDEHVFSHMINMGRFWMFSLYYVVSELWGSAGVPLLFWTCANEVTPMTQAKRFYPLFAILGNLGPIASGQTMAYVSRNRPAGMDAEMAFERTLKILTSLTLGAGGSIMVLYEVIMAISKKEAEDNDALKSPKERRRKQRKLAKEKAKQKMGLLDSFRFLSKSKYLGYVGLIVISYGLSMEFTEIVWKAIVKLAYPDKSDYMAFMGQYSSIVGVTTAFMLLVGKEVIKYLGWEVGALATPVVMAGLAVPFFGYIIFGDIQQSKKALMMAVWVGMVQNVLSKATKYALFDPTKEMAYIPLDKESKVKGKAAIDVLGARLGKSGGALAQQGLVVACGSILTGAPVLATLFAMVSAMWITSVVNLAKLFRVRQAEAEKAAAEGHR